MDREEKTINKGITDGMNLKTADGKIFTKEMYEKFINDKKQGKVKGNFVYKPFIYYTTLDNKVIKYEYKRKLAFILNYEINKWIFSEKITNELITNPNSYKRDYYFRDIYENEWEESLENSSNLNRYFQTGEGLIIKLNTQKHLGYILDYNKKGWILDLGIFEQIKNKNIVASEILFDDKYDIIDSDLDKGRHL